MTEQKKISQMEPWFGGEEQKAMQEYLQSGAWLMEFKKTEELEQMLADYVGAKYACMLPNGTITLIAALLALDIGKGDEVIVPDYTMIASPNAVHLVGATPVLVDIEQESMCLNVEKTREAITKNTKAIMLVAVNGRCPAVEQFAQLAKEHNLHLIEDAAQALGSRHQGKHLGTFGVVGSFSFSVPKVITMGQGGALVTDDAALYEKIEKVKDFGRLQGGADIHESIGYNFKFTDLQAVIGIEQFKKLPWRVERKKEMFQKYQELLFGIEEISFFETNLQDTSPWFIDILVPASQRAGLMAFLKEQGIGTRPFYPAVHTQKPYEWVQGEFPAAEELAERGLWLPSSSFLKDEDIEQVCGAIREFFTKHKTS